MRQVEFGLCGLELAARETTHLRLGDAMSGQFDDGEVAAPDRSLDLVEADADGSRRRRARSLSDGRHRSLGCRAHTCQPRRHCRCRLEDADDTTTTTSLTTARHPKSSSPLRSPFITKPKWRQWRRHRVQRASRGRRCAAPSHSKNSSFVAAPRYNFTTAHPFAAARRPFPAGRGRPTDRDRSGRRRSTAHDVIRGRNPGQNGGGWARGVARRPAMFGRRRADANSGLVT